MITISLSPEGSVQAFCEALDVSDRGYYLDLPQEGDAFMRSILQALLRRQARVNQARPAEAIDVAAVAKWLETHPPQQLTKAGTVKKREASLSDLDDLFPSEGRKEEEIDFPPF